MTVRPGLRPPSGEPAPRTVRIGRDQVNLEAIAREICWRLAAEQPEEAERHGEPGIAWCVHLNCQVLAWAYGDVLEYLSFIEQVEWLARWLDARGVPRERLARNLEIAAAVADGAGVPESAAIVERLRQGAGALREDGGRVPG